MRILMRRNTIVEGEHRGAGEVIEVDDRLGEALILMKKAVAAVAADETEAAAVAPDETEAAAVAPDETAVQPKAKRKS